MSLQKTALVIAGATGDLAQRKLIPALDLLFQRNQLGDTPLIIGTGRSPLTSEEFRNRFSLGAGFSQHLHYYQHIRGIGAYLATFAPFERVIFFLALPPEAHAEIITHIAAEQLPMEVSIVVEKPFGYDLASSQELNRTLDAHFDEKEIYRIDHYLAKEAVQNILVFRFANSLFYPVWNSRYIESIQINALEEEGIVDRGAYFDRSGIIRDIVQNHLLQLLCLITMEAPLTLDPSDIKTQKIQILRSLKLQEWYRYQYEGYHAERGVKSNSATETFAELKLAINNFRWTGIPIFIRTGKAVHRKGTEIGIRFRKLPRLLYNEAGTLTPNHLVFNIQPSESIIVDIQSKIPGTDNQLTSTRMNFCFNSAFKTKIPEAYQRLLYDVLRKDHTLFVSAEESEYAWRFVAPMLENSKITTYPCGSLPPSQLSCNWIDFDAYKNSCNDVQCNI